jgi:nitrogen-specific signal transduction histidine kinase
VTTIPPEVEPVAVALLLTDPVATSPAVMVWIPVQVVVLPGAEGVSVVLAQVAEFQAREKELRAKAVQIGLNGMGMPAEIVQHLFDVSKGHSRKGTGGEKGTGFGMPLMNKFVRQFGGSVEVISRDVAEHPGDSGTEFRIYLPLAS